MTFTGAYVDDAEVYGADFIGPETVVGAFIDGGAVFAGRIIEDDQAPLAVLVGGVEVENTRARSFRAPRDSAGSFSFQLPRDVYLADPTPTFDERVIYAVDGTAVFGGIVKNISHGALEPGEESDQMVTISGPGSLAALRQAPVFPSRGVDTLPIEDVRSFSWVGPDFDSSTWPLAKQVNRQREYADWRTPLPWIWPDTTGYWIWGNVAGVSATFAPSGTCLFRKTITLADDAFVRVFCAFDNSGTLYIDGAEMTAFNGYEVGRYIEIELSAGDHIIAADVKNRTRISVGPNPGGFICAIYTVGNGGLLDELVSHTDGGWSCLPYPNPYPGFTHGEVLLALLDETAGFYGLDDPPVADFTATVDSAGVPWGEYREITVQVGRTFEEVVAEMSDAFIDVEMAPGADVLRAWNYGGRGTNRTGEVELQQTTSPATSDFLRLGHDGKASRLNDVLIRYAGGHLEEQDITAILAEGGKGGFLQLGAIKGEAEARRIARSIMETRKSQSWSTSATLLPRSDVTTPYKGFGLGDLILGPDQDDNAGVEMRVYAIEMREDNDGIITWPVELRDRWYVAEEMTANQLERMDFGAVMGGARVSSPASKPDPFTQQVVALVVAEFSFDNTQLVESLSPRRPSAASGNMVEIFAELTTAGATDTRIQMYHNGVDLGTELVIPAGETVAETPLVVVPTRANLDKLQCEIVEAGTGAEGLDVQVRAI